MQPPIENPELVRVQAQELVGPHVKDSSMQKWKILLTLHGQRLETIIYASSQLRALQLARQQYPEATTFNAIEIP